MYPPPVQNQVRRELSPTFGMAFRGFEYFMSNPRLWLWPLFWTLLLLALTLFVSIATGVMLWPEWKELSWKALLDSFIAIGSAIGAFLALWLLVLPLAFGFVYEGLVRSVLKARGARMTEEPLATALRSSLVFVLRTLGWRILWPVVGLIGSLFLGPVGYILSSLGVGHISAMDAVDLSLSLKGVTGSDRSRYISAQDSAIFSAAAGCGLLSFVLSITVVGWVLYYPCVYTGAAVWVSDLPDDELREAVLRTELPDLPPGQWGLR